MGRLSESWFGFGISCGNDQAWHVQASPCWAGWLYSYVGVVGRLRFLGDFRTMITNPVSAGGACTAPRSVSHSKALDNFPRSQRLLAVYRLLLADTSRDRHVGVSFPTSVRLSPCAQLQISQTRSRAHYGRAERTRSRNATSLQLLL